MNSTNLLIAGVASVLAVSACTTLFPPSSPVRYYSLTPMSADTSAACAVRFGVRPVALPGYVDRDEILIERRGTELVISNTQLWAAPLRNELTRTLGDSIALRWRDSRFVAHPWRFGDTPAWVVDAAFEQLDPAAGSLRVRARWSLSSLGAERESPVLGSAAPPAASGAGASAASGAGASAPRGTGAPAPSGEVAAGRFESNLSLAAASAGATADAIAQAVAQLAERIASEGRAAIAGREPACR